MDAIDYILTRRSVRRYKDIEVEWSKIGELLEAGHNAPSAGNLQDIKMVVVRDESKRRALAEASMKQTWMGHAPVHIVVVSEWRKAKQFYGTRGERLYTIQDAAAVVENILIAAHTQGLGACWVGAFDENMVKRIMNVPDHSRPQAIITIGYPAEKPAMPTKMMIWDTVYLEGYYGKIKDPALAISGEISPQIETALRGAATKLKKHKDKLVKKLKEKLKK